MTHGLGAEFSSQVELLLAKRVRVPKSGMLFGAGAPCRGLYAVRNGSLKTVLVARDGQTQIGDTPIHGDLVGLVGLAGRADQRVAGFLLEVSRRLHAIGYSSTELNLA